MLGVFLTLQFLSYLRLGILSPRGARISQRHGRGVLDYEDANPYYLNVMEDEELLWSASMVHRRPKPPEVVRIPKIAFMFLAVGPLPLAPLWEMYFKGNEDRYNIYVHSLPGYNLEVEQTSPFFGRHVRSQVGLQNIHPPQLLPSTIVVVFRSLALFYFFSFFFPS